MLDGVTLTSSLYLNFSFFLLVFLLLFVINLFVLDIQYLSFPLQRYFLYNVESTYRHIICNKNQQKPMIQAVSL